MPWPTAAMPLILLGGVVQLGDQNIKLERKGLALLAYLALEGVTHRSVLAGLLWPETVESVARNNLRQTIHRMRKVAGHPLMVGEDQLSLAPELQTDVARLGLAAFERQHQEVLRLSGELLAGYDFDDCPEFMDWVVVQRERLLGYRQEALMALSDAAQQLGDLRAALGHAEDLLELDVLSEVNHRRVMRLHYLAGDRGAALQAFSRCQEVLQRELGLGPMPQTLELVREMEAKSTLRAQPPGPEVQRIPLAVQRPPQLVGRTAAWQVLEQAWEQGQVVFIAGAGGIGKSRLAEDFLRSKGEYHLFEAQDGDSNIPYASLLRAYRRLLRTYPGLVPADWVKQELGRLLPELSSSPATTLAMTSSTDRLRFYEAQAFFITQVLELGAARLLIENLHFQDQASIDVWTYVLRHPAVRDCGTFAVITYRPEELNREAVTRIEQTLQGGQGVLLELQPWSARDVQDVIGSLELPVESRLASALRRHTGGNPLFLLETLRSLIESGELGRANPEHLPLPSRLEPLVARRLERLSPLASRLASAAAVAGNDFTLELAAQVLEVGLLDLNDPWLELRAAQVLDETGFVHDLLAQAALAQVATPIRQLLHRRTAQYLENHYLEGIHGDAARMAHHWQQGNDSLRAAPWLVRAGEGFLLQGAAEQAALVFQQALNAAPPTPLRLAALKGLGRSLLGQDLTQAEVHLQQLHCEAQEAHNTTEVMEAGGSLAEVHLMRGELEKGLQLVEQAIELLPSPLPAAQRPLARELWRGKYWLELRSGRLPQAEQAIQTALALTPDSAITVNELALLLWHAGRFEEAAALYDDLARPRAGQPAPAMQDVWIAGNWAWTLWALARNDQAARLLDGALKRPGAPFDRGLRLSNLSVILTSQGHYQQALTSLQEAQQLLRGYHLNMVDVLYRLGVVYYRADQYAPARDLHARAVELARKVGDPYRLAYTLASLGADEALLGQMAEAQAHCAEALAISEHIQFPLATIIAEQAASVTSRLAGQHAQALQHIERALNIAVQCGMPEQIGHSHLFRAQLPGGHVQADLQSTLEIGQQYQLPDLLWRAATALNDTGTAQNTLKLLRAQSPAGWFS